MISIGARFLLLSTFCFALSSFAAGPIMELYPKHLTMLTDFDDNTVQARIGDLVCQTTSSGYALADTGLFGSTGLKTGGFQYMLPEGQTVLDMTKSGTVLFWLKMDTRPDPVVKNNVSNEPTATHFSVNWNTPRDYINRTKRLLCFRQADIKWGESTLASFFETYKDAGAGPRYVLRSDYAASYRDWQPGSWHLCAVAHTPNGFGFSLDGQPFRMGVSTEPLGALTGNMIFRNPDEGYLTMDDCVILDFKMSDGQVKQLYDEYQAQLQESPRTGREPTFGTLQTVSTGTTTYSVGLAATNETAETITLVWTASATPDRSQPVVRNEKVTLAPGESHTFELSGVISGEESIVSEVTVTSEDGARVFFKRKRVFAPNSPEPSWMHDQSAMSFSSAYYPYENTIHATVGLSGYTNWTAATAIRLSVLDATNKVLVATADFPAGAFGTTEIFWRNIPELNGTYVCRAEAVGIENSATEQEFVRYRFAWEHNQLGLSDAVPEPFEPVRKSAVSMADARQETGDDSMAGDGGLEKVSVVLRDHYIDPASGLWRQVMAAGKPLLARPMALVDGDRQHAAAIASDRAQSIAAESSWDIDGLCILKLTLPAGHHEPLALDIPLRAERTKIMHVCGDGLRSNYAGAIPPGEGLVWRSADAWKSAIIGSYRPYVWVGGPLRGFAVMGENDKGWVVNDDGEGDGRSCQEIWREPDGTIVLRLNLVQHAVDLTEPQVIKLGFQVTPVKPMLENWRAVGHGTLLGGCMYWGGYWDSVEPYDGTDEFLRVMGEERQTGVLDYDYLYRAVDNFPYVETPGTEAWSNRYDYILAHFRNGLYNAAQVKFNHNRLVFYTNGRGVWYGDTKGQGATFCDSWSKSEYMSRKFTVGSHEAYDMDPSISFRDYAAWWYERMLGTGAADAIYWDDIYPTAVNNPVETDAYRRPDGQMQGSSGIFTMRALIKRCAVLQKEMGKDCRGNWVHMTNTAMTPICAFAGVNYDWEDLASTNTFQQRYTREYIQACTIGRQMGNRVGIMGYFPKDDPVLYDWLAHTGVGVMLAHELRWNESGHDEYKRVHDALCAWGYRTDAVKVWNYFDEDVAYPVETEGLTEASIAMAKPEAGEAFLCFSNFDGTNGTLRVTPDLRAMGFGPGPWTATLMATNSAGIVETESLPVADGSFTLNLPRYDWALVKIRAPRQVVPVDLASLPDGYDELMEFVEADGSQWIDTGFRPNPHRSRLSARFIPLSPLPTGASPDRTILFGVNGVEGDLFGQKNFNAVLARGSDRNEGYQICPIWVGSDGGGYHYPNTGGYVPGKAYEISFGLNASNKAEAFVNRGHKCGGYYARYDGVLGANLFLGDINNAGTGLLSEATNGWARGCVRWLGFRATDSDGVVRLDLRPAKRQGVVGFWDAVSGKFFASRGDQGFIGPERAAWAEGAIPAAGKVAVIAAGQTRQVSYADVVALNQLSAIRMEGADSSLVFTNGNLSSVSLYTPIFGHGRVMNYESNPHSTCTLQFQGDSSGFDGIFVASNAATAATFAPYAFGVTNRVIIDTANGGTLDRRRFSIDGAVYRNEFRFVRADNMFIGYGTPTVASTLYLDLPGGATFHGNVSGFNLNGPIVTTVTNDASTIYLNGNITLGGGVAAVKDFARKHVQGSNPTTLGSPLRFGVHPYHATIYNNCHYSWNAGARTTFTLANVFDADSFVLANYAAANTATSAATFDLNGHDQQVGTLGVYVSNGFDSSVHWNPNMSISSSTPATLTIRKTCRNDFATGVFHGTIRGAASVCLDSADETPGRFALNCPGSDTTGTIAALRGEIEILPTATCSNLASLVIGRAGKVILDTAAVGNANPDFRVTLERGAVLDIAADVTVRARFATQGGRRLRPGKHVFGGGQLQVLDIDPPSGFKILIK